LVLDQTHERP